MTPLLLVLTVLTAAEPLGPGDHLRTLQVDGRTRTHLVHVPSQYDPENPTPLVLAFHGSSTNGPIMALSSGLNRKADEAGFVAVYPNGTGKSGFFFVWNTGGGVNSSDPQQADDVRFVERLLDDLSSVISIDPKRIYATGHSSGGGMCYRLAAELAHRIAAIAPVGAVMAADCRPKKPVPVMHFHGTDDARVPFSGFGTKKLKSYGFRSVSETINVWVRANHCRQKPLTTRLPDKVDDGTTVKRLSYTPGKNGAEVVLFVIEGGGHTWPGQEPLVSRNGKSTMDICANDLIWEFFERHPLR
jgi:polyhydroxybutyrate depolymerase